MTPKEAYEARKAARIEARRVHPQQTAARHADKDEEMTDLLDRFVTAVERIADALEPRSKALDDAEAALLRSLPEGE